LRDERPNEAAPALLAHGPRLARGAALNFTGQVLPLIVGVAAVPTILHRLGAERFGIFSLTLAVLGTATQFDMGMPRATTKFLAELLSAHDEGKFRQTFWTSLVVQVLIGVVIGALMLLLIPAVGLGMVKVSSGLVHEAELSLVFIALSLPFVMLTSMTKGALDAGQHFGITNSLRIPLSSMMYVIPVIGLWRGLGLPGIFAWILAARMLIAGMHVAYCFVVYRHLARFDVDFRRVRPLMSFGGWVLIAGLVVAGLTSVDRFLIGAICTTADVGFYSAPVDALGRLFILPASFVSVLFPTFSRLARGDGANLARVFGRSLKFLILLMAPLALTFSVFAHPILRFWLGPAFAAQSAGVFRLASLTVLVSSIGWIPYALLQAIGRPDLPARFILLESPIFLGMLWVMIHRFGPAGAAGATLIRASVEVAWFLWALRKVRPDVFRAPAGARSLAGAVAAVALIGVCWPLVWALEKSAAAQVSIFAAALCGFVWITWRRALEPSERSFVLSFLTRSPLIRAAV
jgi:O-antigen/teichoic acid export membrane protein